jgi:endonuclease YncB( thermonuclease family)
MVLSLLLIVSFAAQVATVPEVAGRVVGVADGDTLTVLDADKKQHRIRISGIDAPEIGQPFANRAKQTLSELAFNREVRVEVIGTDKYGREVGRVLVDGEDASLKMLKAGMAWHFDKFDDSPEYASAQAEAREAKAGLWSATDPISPWQWRTMSKADRDRVRAAVADADLPSDEDEPEPREGYLWVKGYTRKDGVQVRGHWRKAK